MGFLSALTGGIFGNKASKSGEVQVIDLTADQLAAWQLDKDALAAAQAKVTKKKAVIADLRKAADTKNTELDASKTAVDVLWKKVGTAEQATENAKLNAFYTTQQVGAQASAQVAASKKNLWMVVAALAAGAVWWFWLRK